MTILKDMSFLEWHKIDTGGTSSITGHTSAIGQFDFLLLLSNEHRCFGDYFLLFLFFDMSTQKKEKWKFELTSDLHFMKHDPYLIELPLENYFGDYWDIKVFFQLLKMTK